MKIAICLYGLSTGKNDKGNTVSFERSYEMLKKNILDLNDTDIFIHTWTEDKKTINYIKELYKPTSSIFEEQIMFADTSTKHHSTKSRWYSHMRSVEFKKQHEKKENFIYDFVIVSRFDNVFITPFNFTEYEPRFFYSSNWIAPHNIKGFLDYWFLSDSETMDSFSNLYHKIDSYLYKDNITLSNHVLSKHHAIQIGLEENLKYIKTEKIDFVLERCI